MAEMTYKEIISDLKKKIYHPVYFLTGEESYFIDSIAERIEQDILTEPEKDFNLHILYGRDITISNVIDFAKQIPMMANYQVVIVREAQDLSDFDLLKNYLGNPNSSSILVLCYKNKKFDKRKTIYKVLQSKAIFFDSKQLSSKQIPAWIEEYLKVQSYTITPKAVMLLSEYIGNDISKISNEIGKLLINLPKNTQITDSHIETNIGINKDYNVFELINALGEKNVLKANRIINYFGANSKTHSIFMVLPLLFDFFIKIMIYHECENKNDKKLLASVMGINPYIIDQFHQAATRYSHSKLVRIVGYCKEYDMKAKGVNNATATEGELLKELIFKILH